MSALLDALLGPARLAECLAHDAALTHPKEQAMRHPVHLGRVFADMEASSEPEDGELYEIRITRGMVCESRKQWFPNSNAANLEAASLSCGGAVVMVQPVSECYAGSAA